MNNNSEKADLLIENIDDEICQQFLAKCERLGMSEAIAIEAFMKRFIDDGGENTSLDRFVAEARPYPIVENGQDLEKEAEAEKSIASGAISISSSSKIPDVPAFCEKCKCHYNANEGHECEGV